MQIVNIYACGDCGVETEWPTQEEQPFAYGRCVECPNCHSVYAAIYSAPKGGKVWIKIDESDVKWHRLGTTELEKFLEEIRKEEEES